MQGLELAKKYYETYGIEMLKADFSEVLPYLAIGLTGSGSECSGFDDEISTDHDFEPGFCIFLPDENTVDRRTKFLLERAYATLPKEFLGFTRASLNPVGGNRHGVKRISEFFLEKTGSAEGKLSLAQWFSVPEQNLLEATNGEIFCDNFGQLSLIREKLRYFPENVRLKNLQGICFLWVRQDNTTI